MEQIIDLLASFFENGRTLKTKLQIISYAHLKFGSQHKQRQDAGRADSTRVASVVMRVASESRQSGRAYMEISAFDIFSYFDHILVIRTPF